MTFPEEMSVVNNATPSLSKPFSGTGPPEKRGPLNINDLPMEMIVKIFTYLNGNDIMAARQACVRFLDAALYFRLVENIAINMYKINFDISEEPVSLLMASPWSYRVFTLDKCRFGNCESFFRIHGDQIIRLQFKGCPIKKEKLIQILYCLDNLETLEIDECNELFKNWKEIDWDLYGVELFKLRKLTLRHINYLSQAALVILLEMAPNLETFELIDSFRECHDNAVRIRCIDTIIALLSSEIRAPHIRRVNFQGTHIPDENLLQLSEIEIMKLEGLGLSFVGHLTNPGFYDLLYRQHHLTELDLTGSAHILDPVLKVICKEMPQLKVLKLRNCIRIGDNGIEKIIKLSKLEVLDLNGCENVTDYGLSPALFGILPIEKKPNVRELYLGGNPNYPEIMIVKAIVEFTKLTILDLASTSNCVTDYTMQVINKFLVNLTYLNLENCVKFSDAGLTGFGMDEVSIQSLEGSYSIRRLKALRTLNLNGCIQLSDYSFMDFAFLELKDLSLAWCHRLTERGIEYLATHCPSLEHVDFTGCYGINDVCVEYICANLHRLRSLKLVGCVKLTNLSLDSIAYSCKRLQDLHLRGCHNIGANPEKVLACLPALRCLHYKTYV